MIFLLGMHRSGTSALAGMLHSGGIVLGDKFTRPLPENPKGFFEDLKVQNINKQILASIGKDWNNIIEESDLLKTPDRLLQLLPIVYRYFESRFQKWAWKDPRLCLTFPLWAKILPLDKLHVLFILRSPMSVARSLYQRNKMPLEKGMELWAGYNYRITSILKQYELPYTFIRYESLISKPEIHQKLLERQLKVKMGDAWSFIDNKLNRSETENSKLPKHIEDTYKRIVYEWDNTENLLTFLDDKDLKAGENSFENGDLEDAKACFENVLDRYPNHPDPYNNLGVIEFFKGNHDEALQLFDKSLDADNNYFDALINKANLHKNTGDFQNAINEYGKAYKIERNDIEIINSLGECYLKTEDLKNAYRFYSRSFEIDKNQTLIGTIVERLNLLEINANNSVLATEISIQKPVHFAGERKLRFYITSFVDTEKNSARKLRWGDYWVKFEIQKELEKRGYIVTGYNPDVILHLFGIPTRGLRKDCYNILWIHSHPDLITPQILKQYDKIYCLSPLFLNKIIKWGFDAYLLIGGTAKSPIKSFKKHDIVFVGNAKNLPFGRKIIADLLAKKTHLEKLKVWGEGWESILSKENFGGIYYENDLLPELYASSRIVLNDHHEDMRRDGFLNPRILDVFASGGFVISDDIKGLDQIFGKTLVTYKNPDDLNNLINHFLENSEERERTIRDGQKIALNFSFSNMVEKILSDIEQSGALLVKQETIIPGDRVSYTTAGQILLDKEKYSQAEEYFQNAFSENARNPDAAFGFAKICLEKGQKEDAILALKKCVSINPQYKDAKDLLKQALLDSIPSKAGEIIPLHQYTYVHVASDTKNLDLEMTPAVIVAFHMISKHNPEMSLLVYSLKALKEYPWEVIDIVKQNSSICFKEIKPETIDMSKGSIFVYTADSPFCEKYLISALLLGIPVVGTDTAYTRNHIQDGYTGLLVKTENRVHGGNSIVNLNELAKKMYFLGQDPELILQMSINVQQEFRSNKMAPHQKPEQEQNEPKSNIT